MRNPWVEAIHHLTSPLRRGDKGGCYVYNSLLCQVEPRLQRDRRSRDLSIVPFAPDRVTIGRAVENVGSDYAKHTRKKINPL